MPKIVSFMEILDSDILILGTGIAGFTSALHASEASGKLRISMISKLHAMRSHSVAAEGGISGVLYPGTDSKEIHAYDTVKGSDYLADQDAVELLAENAPGEIKFFDHIGVPWNRGDGGKIQQRPFGGMSSPRTAFAADKTGFFMMRALYDEALSRENIGIFHEHFATKLLIINGKSIGAFAFDIATGEEKIFRAKACIIATGGASRTFGFTTTSYSTTGDGTAMAYREGIPLKNMEFVQFHPTGLVPSGILITEAARGEGAYLINSKGERFMADYAKSKMELAPRDIVSRAIITEINKGNGLKEEDSGMEHVLLDLRHLDKSVINVKLPMVKELTMKMLDLDPSKEPIPVRPVAHFTMGGIHTDINGRILMADGKPLAGAWAIGEAGCVSVHGANRLGSNSLSQCSVWGRLAGKAAADYALHYNGNIADERSMMDVASAESARISSMLSSKGTKTPYDIRERLCAEMDKNMCVFRTSEGMAAAEKAVLGLMREFKDIYIEDKGSVYNTNLRDAFETENLLTLAYAIVVSAKPRLESRGAHAMVEYPKRDDSNWLKHTLVYRHGEGYAISYIPVKITRWKPEERRY